MSTTSWWRSRPAGRRTSGADARSRDIRATGPVGDRAGPRRRLAMPHGPADGTGSIAGRPRLGSPHHLGTALVDREARAAQRGHGRASPPGCAEPLVRSTRPG
ncbi:hypothetical protein FTX61_07555 [Nitriliruptoraceae bacterium ZYF776]|nr:hypothetical protein [Profundirhabdus halotolerans]